VDHKFQLEYINKKIKKWAKRDRDDMLRKIKDEQDLHDSIMNSTANSEAQKVDLKTNDAANGNDHDGQGHFPNLQNSLQKLT